MEKNFDPKTIEALATLRQYAAGERRDVRQAFNTLDNAGVFAALDEQTDYASAEEVLADLTLPETQEAPLLRGGRALDPSEWGDTTRADMARHQGYAAASRLGKLERVPGTDTLRPVHEHVFNSAHSDEVCCGADWCPLTYGEHRARP